MHQRFIDPRDREIGDLRTQLARTNERLSVETRRADLAERSAKRAWELGLWRSGTTQQRRPTNDSTDRPAGEPEATGGFGS